jgi:hypothetical protein
MLRITIDIVPFGLESKKKTLRTLEISNIGGGKDDSTADYLVRFAGEEGNTYKRSRIRSHKRKYYGPWNLVLKAIQTLDAPSE